MDKLIAESERVADSVANVAASLAILADRKRHISRMRWRICSIVSLIVNDNSVAGYLPPRQGPLIHTTHVVVIRALVCHLDLKCRKFRRSDTGKVQNSENLADFIERSYLFDVGASSL
jgi:hypothetical protein